MTKRGNDAVHRGAIVIGYLLTCHALVQVHVANVRPCGAGDIVHFNQLQIAPMMGIQKQTDSAKPNTRALRARRACSGVIAHSFALRAMRCGSPIGRRGCRRVSSVDTSIKCRASAVRCFARYLCAKSLCNFWHNTRKSFSP